MSSEDTILETVGEKAQAIHDAVKSDKKCMVMVPYPIGWICSVPVKQIGIPVERLDDVEIKRSSISGNLSFEVKKAND